MAGASIQVEFDDSEVQAALNRLIAASENLTPLMDDIGNALIISTQARFETQTAPDGTPWAPLTENTKRRKKQNRDKILTLSGTLGTLINHIAGPDQVEVGSPRIYAGTHQYGAFQGSYGYAFGGTPIPFGDIPARPFLGLSDEDEGTILALVNKYLAEQLPS